MTHEAIKGGMTCTSIEGLGGSDMLANLAMGEWMKNFGGIQSVVDNAMNSIPNEMGGKGAGRFA
jgi:hypothetical protein